MSSDSELLSRNPETPWRIASSTTWSSSKVVSIRTAGGSASSRTCRAASKPLRRGIPDVHQHDVGRRLPHHPQGVLAVDRLADHLEVGLGVDQQPKPGTHHRLVVDENHPHARPAHGAPR